MGDTECDNTAAPLPPRQCQATVFRPLGVRPPGAWIGQRTALSATGAGTPRRTSDHGAPRPSSQEVLRAGADGRRDPAEAAAATGGEQVAQSGGRQSHTEAGPHRETKTQFCK